MSTTYFFFICPVCFEVCDTCRECHGHTMVCCDVKELDDEGRKPVVDASGLLISRAPRWFLEAMGWIPVGYTPDPAPKAS